MRKGSAPEAKIEYLDRTKEELEILNRAKDKVLHHLSHELKTSLAVIACALSMVENRGKSSGVPDCDRSLDAAVNCPFLVVVLTAHPLTPEALKRSIEMVTRPYLPKDNLDEIVPFLEDVLHREYRSDGRLPFERLIKDS